WALVLLFSVCCALRLARFNTMLGQPDPPAWAYNFFTGIPAPAAAIVVMLPMMLTFQLGHGFFSRPAVVGAFLVGVSFLMVSTIPTFSGKKLRIPVRYVLPTLLAVGLLAAFLVSAPWTTISAVAIIYVLTIPLSYLAFRRLRQDAAANPPEAGETPIPPDSNVTP
ncbi:MAG: CDP-diacylglycerol O-phosphatidyltransferase, partial [Rhodospirillales bacterium]|nr:CDP-diacylglycerol O-phosphatidyltransferase [Rhodospirillales bacterium]